jgi:hypothetical protein
VVEVQRWCIVTSCAYYLLTVPDFQYTDDSTKRISICAETKPVLMEDPARRLWHANVDTQATSPNPKAIPPAKRARKASR